ncbi:MAG: GTP-binding protein [Anaerolineaceae bacterium]|nr:GTP-binding protein [Anaerolineaceae bacterium]
MKIHLVSGFLGSGKTTAIISASKALMAQGLKVGVITNDQGKYLVDTHFMRLNDIPAVEVNGGCFCCNYGDFNKSLEQIVEQVKPDVIFAESVGSCADIVATVVKPLLEFKTAHEEDTSLSTFTDARLLKAYLTGEELPFQENVIYIFEEQIQEAGVLIINKMDLLAANSLDQLIKLAQKRYLNKKILPLHSLTPDGVQPWLNTLSAPVQYPPESLSINYQLYGMGEQELAWYDAQLKVDSGNQSAVAWVQDYLRLLVQKIIQDGIPIGHLKFLISDGSRYQKLSIVSGDSDPNLVVDQPEKWGAAIELTVNARLECSSEKIQEVFTTSLQQATSAGDVKVTMVAEDSFHPGFPNPTYRFPKIS